METKKSSRADLEGSRGQRFLLGLVVALALLFVGLEFSVSPSDPLDDAELLDQLTVDDELPPLAPPDRLLSLAPKAEPRPSAVITVAEDEPEAEPLQDDEPVETDMTDDLDAQAEETAPEPPVPVDDDVVSLRVVEDVPQFPGGMAEFAKWLTRNLKYPAPAQAQKQQGRVIAEFIVNKDGSVTDVKIVTSLNDACDREVLRVLRTMPRWTAGVMNGEPCRTKVCIPIVFKLE